MFINPREMIDKAGGRRFILCMLVCLTTSVLQWFGKLDPSGGTFAMVILGTAGIYVGGNTTQKVMTAPQEPAQ